MSAKVVPGWRMLWAKQKVLIFTSSSAFDQETDHFDPGVQCGSFTVLARWISRIITRLRSVSCLLDSRPPLESQQAVCDAGPTRWADDWSRPLAAATIPAHMCWLILNAIEFA